MKKLLLIPIVSLLSGCVSYYYPVEEPSSGVTYVPARDYVNGGYYEEDPGYGDEPSEYYEDDYVTDSHFSSSISSAAYYPWWSIDYFYLAPHRHSHYSVGINYGYTPFFDWYDPFWSPAYSSRQFVYWPYRSSYWYSPFRRDSYFGYNWNNFYWSYRYDRHHRNRHRDHDRYVAHERRRQERGRSEFDPYERDRHRDSDHFSGNDRDRADRRRRGEDGPVGDDARNPAGSGTGLAGVNRRVGAARGGRGGMEIRNRGQRKVGPTRTENEPAPIASTLPVDRGNAPVRDFPRTVRSPRGSGEIRSSGAGKGERTRTTPVRGEPVSPSGKITSADRPARPVVSSRRGSTVVRSPQERKRGKTRTQPTDPAKPVTRLSPVVSYKPPVSSGTATRRSSSGAAIRSRESSDRSKRSGATRPQPAKPSLPSSRTTPASGRITTMPRSVPRNRTSSRSSANTPRQPASRPSPSRSTPSRPSRPVSRAPSKVTPSRTRPQVNRSKPQVSRSKPKPTEAPRKKRQSSKSSDKR